MTDPTTPAGEGAAAGQGREILQRGRYFDELEVGDRYLHRPGRTATEADDVQFTTLTMNGQPLHLDAAWAATQPFGRRLMNSMWTLSTLVGLSTWQVTLGTLVANLGFEKVTFPAPVFHGDTVYAETNVLAKRASASRPGQGIVTLEHVGRNQDDVVVARAVRNGLFWTRAAHEAAEAEAGPVQGRAAQGPAGPDDVPDAGDQW
ncbi:MaoC family dehydratase [Myceligenerans pegani]|uniref:MaoC family dehydratase n=1 Tax=Myceligenerans pegani TaxID=2776917 RepID=A0ABR9N3B7_9MICO|nr:MaoC family dehydratase [Myceligenerans sp. TRM 65318]MBE1878146.1 MaoC family dehydratase [Myceligenerans sp. TRM 65318]MBE3020417.1 MaoC family dehydratase [Myceligenerans sp. TRM 65318]